MQYIKKYIIDNANRLDMKDKNEIYRIISTSADRDKLKESANGSRINLDMISEDLLLRIHKLIEYKINRYLST